MMKSINTERWAIWSARIFKKSKLVKKNCSSAATKRRYVCTCITPLKTSSPILLNYRYGAHHSRKQFVQSCWQPSQWRKDIIWLNQPGPLEMGVVYLAASIGTTRFKRDALLNVRNRLSWRYSYAAILVTVPSFSERALASSSA